MCRRCCHRRGHPPPPPRDRHTPDQAMPPSLPLAISPWQRDETTARPATNHSPSGCTNDFSMILSPRTTGRWTFGSAFEARRAIPGCEGSIVPLRIHSSAIRYFDAVRRAKSIREAARQLNVASSAVNRQIIKLEEEIGEPLFHRLPTRPRADAGRRGAGAPCHHGVPGPRADRRRDRRHPRRADRPHHGRGGGERRFVDPAPGDRPESAPGRRASPSPLSSWDRSTFPAAVVSGEVDVGVAFALRKSSECSRSFSRSSGSARSCGRTTRWHATRPSRCPRASAFR